MKTPYLDEELIRLADIPFNPNNLTHSSCKLERYAEYIQIKKAVKDIPEPDDSRITTNHRIIMLQETDELLGQSILKLQERVTKLERTNTLLENSFMPIMFGQWLLENDYYHSEKPNMCFKCGVEHSLSKVYDKFISEFNQINNDK